jgi:hypothetical protein
MSSSLREQRSDSMTAPFKLEPKVTHLYATQHSYPHLAQSPYTHTHTHRQEEHKGNARAFPPFLDAETFK